MEKGKCFNARIPAKKMVVNVMVMMIFFLLVCQKEISKEIAYRMLKNENYLENWLNEIVIKFIIII